MCKSGIWSVKWAASELQSRWREVLYDEKVAIEAAEHMWSIVSQARKPRWSDSETKVLEQAKNDSTESAVVLFEKHREVWHPTRTLGQVEKRLKDLKRALHKEEGASGAAPSAAGKKSGRAARGDSNHDSTSTPSSKRGKKGSEAASPSASTAPNSSISPAVARKSYPWQAHQDVLGILVGDNFVFELREMPAIIGRKAVNPSADQALHVNLSDEGDASTISRTQALIDSPAPGLFTFEQKGKATTSIDGRDLRNTGPVTLNANATLQFTNLSLTWIPRPQ